MIGIYKKNSPDTVEPSKWQLAYRDLKFLRNTGSIEKK